uniref:DUF7733 domain-containing protein n=1 Tax=Leersia perrieri TaxID=77586 RepID=A0A0D9XM53_9ORYZ
MSGGVGPTCGGGITLPSTGAPPPPLHPTPTSPTSSRPHHHYYLFSIKQLNSFGAAAVLAFSTTVPLTDIAFALLVIPYLAILSSIAFPQKPGKPDPAAPIYLGGRARRALHWAYDAAGFLLGAALPALYILDGLRSGDTAGVAAASPHAFLLAAQIFTEGLAAAWPARFSLPVRAAVVVMYGARRMFAASEWLSEEMEKRDQFGGVGGAAAVAKRRVVAGRALAVANLAYWGFNLFAFLLPFYIPKALDRYYCGRGGEEDHGAVAAAIDDVNVDDDDDDAKKKKDS